MLHVASDLPGSCKAKRSTGFHKMWRSSCPAELSRTLFCYSVNYENFVYADYPCNEEEWQSTTGQWEAV
jgi:hypothetical protein